MTLIFTFDCCCSSSSFPFKSSLLRKDPTYVSLVLWQSYSIGCNFWRRGSQHKSSTAILSANMCSFCQCRAMAGCAPIYTSYALYTKKSISFFLFSWQGITIEMRCTTCHSSTWAEKPWDSKAIGHTNFRPYLYSFAFNFHVKDGILWFIVT